MENMLSDILSQYDRWEIEQYTKDTLIEAVKEQTFPVVCLCWMYLNRVMKCYQDRAYDYILKPLHDSDMRREISRYFKESNIQQRCLRITFNGTESYIPIDSIQYIERYLLPQRMGGMNFTAGWMIWKKNWQEDILSDGYFIEVQIWQKCCIWIFAI